MDDNLLDYKHNHPINVSNCVAMLLKIFNNVLEHPEEQKFRQVKAGGNAFRNNISSIKGGEKLMTLAGWRVQVKDMEKYYVFEGDPGSRKMDILRETANTLQKAMATVNEKAERKRQEMQAAGAMEKARKEQILRALEDDKEDRKLRSGKASGNM
uniref:PUB domain-containing protein n=2 Tax=Dunaliella tertiolecta TaxID=3047 RepID=A0A7S3QRY1_DUNTE